MKATKRNISLLIGLVAVIAVAIVYVYVYLPYQTKTEAVRNETKTLTARLTTLEEYKRMKPTYTEAVAEMLLKEQELVTFFPADIKPEDEIMLVTDMEKTTGMKISSVTYGTPINVAVINDKLYTYKTPMSISYTVSYDGLKSLVEFMRESEERKTIDSVNMSFDGTNGMLSGSMIINLYFMYGTDKIYEAPIVPIMPIGTDNIFNTIE